MEDFNTVLEELRKGINNAADKASVMIEESVKGIGGTLQIEKKKLELKSQIGQHQRTITKAYARIGEAYVNQGDMESVKDVVELVKSNQKLIALLQEQLDQLEK